MNSQLSEVSDVVALLDRYCAFRTRQRGTERKNTVSFLEGYRPFAAARRAAAVGSFQARFIRLRDDYQVEKATAQVYVRRFAPGFNIFRLLGVQSKEQQTHSALLAELLDPAGDHGQQHHFLKRFLAHCLKKFGDDIFYVESLEKTEWLIRTEYTTPTGRLDILIRNPELGVQYVIENKIYSGEQWNQIRRYADWLATQEEVYSRQALLFLTRHGDVAVTHGGAHYYRLSYREDISGWLENALKEVEAASVQETLAQYLNLIESL